MRGCPSCAATVGAAARPRRVTMEPPRREVGGAATPPRHSYAGGSFGSLPRKFYKTNVEQMPDRVLDDSLGQSRLSAQGVQRPKSAALIEFDNSRQNGKFCRSQIIAFILDHDVIPLRCHE